jgi:general L-amino acid transport system permease protein
MNVAANLQRLGVKTGFGFLARPAGFDIAQTLIGFDESATYLSAFTVALLNTLLVTALSIVLATTLGFVIALARGSSNGLVAAMAAFFVETFRNIPLLLQLLFWYFAVIQTLPGPRASLRLGDLVFLNNRGLFIPSLHLGAGSGSVIAAAIVGLVLTIGVGVASRQQRINTGQNASYRWFAPVPVVVFPLVAAFLTGADIAWTLPKLTGFNFEGGITVLPELFALTLGLSIYAAAFISEILRGGIQAISPGQIDAARSLGLKRRQIARLIILPLALRVIMPPLGAYYVILLKNSSLGSAIAYPDLIHIFAGTVLNQTGQPIEVMIITLATYLALGLALSAATSGVNAWLRR